MAPRNSSNKACSRFLERHAVEFHLSGEILFVNVESRHRLRSLYLENHLSSVASAS